MAQQSPGEEQQLQLSATIAWLESQGVSGRDIVAFRLELMRVFIAAKRGNCTPAEEIIAYLTSALGVSSAASQRSTPELPPNCS